MSSVFHDFRSRGISILILGAMALAAAGCAARRADRVGPPATRVPEVTARLPKSPLLDTFQIVDVQERRFSSEVTFTNGARVLKIEVVPHLGPEGAQILLEDGVMGVQALYANALSPYPGDISREVITDARYRPTLVRTNWNGRERTFVLVFANDRFGHGAMAADAVRYRALVGWFYCERAEVFYKVRCFLPLAARRDELESLFLSLGCP